MQIKPIDNIQPHRAERFWERVNKDGPDDCWLWAGVVDMGGYASFALQSVNYRATHVALTLMGRPRPSSAHVALHECQNRSCVNPAHIRWGTHTENVDDAVRHGAVKRTLTPEQVREIRRSTDNPTVIAKRMGVFQSTVRSVQLHKTYKWVE